MEVRMERRFSMDDLLEAGRVRESAQAQRRRLGWLQPHSARRGRGGAGAVSDRELRASGRRGVGSGERGVGSGSAGRRERGVGRGGGARRGRGEGWRGRQGVGSGGRGGGGGRWGRGGRGVGSGSAERAEGGGGSGRGERGEGGVGSGSAERGEREARGSPMPRSGASRWRALQCGGYARLKPRLRRDRKSTRLNSSHVAISYAVFCLKKKKKNEKARSHNRNDKS